MEPFKVHILGCGSALPTPKHFPSSQIVEMRGKFFMVDCGEGTQLQIRRVRVGFNKIQAVFISHLHGDHCFGLIGMISTFGLLGRTAALHIYAPKELKPILDAQIALFCRDLGYDVEFHAVDTRKHQIIYEDHSLTVESLPLVHRMPTCGFLFREKPTQRHILRDMIDCYDIPLSQINNIKAGASWTTPDGEVIPNERLTSAPDPVRSYAYCSDTRYQPELHKLLGGVSLLYHESTYASDFEDRAKKYCHSTAAQAATVARDANVGKLLLGHYSARYEDENILLDEARAVFPNSILSYEHQTIDIDI